MKGDRRSSSWPYHGNSASLPPRSPTFPNVGCPSSEKFVSSYRGQKKFSHEGIQREHQRTVSASILMDEQLSWLDDLLDDSDAPSKKGIHRHSASDSFTFLEAPGSLYKISDIAEEDEFDCSNSPCRQYGDSTGKDHSGGGQLISLQVGIEQLERERNLPVNLPCRTWTSENGSVRMMGYPSITLEKASSLACSSVTEAASECNLGHLMCESEVHRVDDLVPGDTWRHPIALGVSTDPNIDPTQVKRQSAQRSRVRKLQYISELEKTVNSLQTELSMLSPQVAYLEHERMVLNVDNNLLRQRISVCVKNKKAKDAQIDTLMKEVQKWRMFYQLQLQQQKQLHPEVKPSAVRHRKSISLDLDIPLEEFGKLDLNPSEHAVTRPLVSNSFLEPTKKLGSVPLGAGTSVGNVIGT
eukprot:c27796_g2_i3 orf=257-1492(-)